jgi:hypothetical protein
MAPQASRNAQDATRWPINRGCQEGYLSLILAISSAESIHSSLKPQEPQRYRVTLTALKMVDPTLMLFPAPKARASPGIRTMSAD